MAVLHWGHSRNQTSTSSDKTKSSALDWLPRGATEPSRQAISSLMKQHSRPDSAGSGSLRGRSRTGTPTSSHRSAASTDSRKGQVATDIKDKSGTSHSRPSTPVRPGTSTIERSDSTSKSLFQKAALLRRQGSKMGRSFTPSHGGGVVSPTQPTSSRAGFRPKDAPTSPVTEISPRPSISKPYDFAHVMHGAINAFGDLGRIDESDLALQFDAIQARYRNITEFGHPLPREPQALSPTRVVKRSINVAASPQLSVAERPSTPPSALPLKNSPTLSSTPTDIRTSRSTENFSRPNPRSLASSSTILEARPSSCHLLTSKAAGSATDALDSSNAKPLPQLPSLVHAVSTQVDTARPLILAPLPTPPPTFEKGSPKQPRQSFSRGFLGQVSTLPSPRQTQYRDLPQDSHSLDIRENNGPLRPQSDYKLDRPSCGSQAELHAFQEAQSVKAEDWEIAIDSAWDLDDDVEFTSDHRQSPRPFSIQSKDRETYLALEPYVADDGSSPATPLMSTAPTISCSQHVARLERSPSLADHSDASQQIMRDNSALVGLGIETQSGVPTRSHALRPSNLESITTDTNRISSRQTRSTYSGISHSSSQESIIFSIASSIMSTQRSSMSSISVSDYAHAGKPERASVANSVSSPLLNVSTQKAARPESTCLPPALLQQMNLEAQKMARPDSTCLPSVLPSRRNSGVTKSNRPDSMGLTEDMLATFPVPVNTSRRRSAIKSVSVDKETDCDDDNVSDLPSNVRNVLGSRTSNAARKPTNISRDSTPTRQHSSTQDSRSRQSRVSYSLFPSAPSSSSTPSNTDVEGVA